MKKPVKKPAPVKKTAKKSVKTRPKVAAKKASSDPAEMDPKFAAVAEAFANERGVTAGRMMSAFGLKVGGKIFAMFSKDAFVVKLPKARVDALVSAKKGVRFDPRKNGSEMKEWLSIADRKAPWLELAKEAHRFVKAGS